jgi:hypothetical protein
MFARYVLQLLFCEKSQYLTTTKDREQMRTDLESLDFYKFFDVCLNKFNNNPIFKNIISDRFLLTTKQFTG